MYLTDPARAHAPHRALASIAGMTNYRCSGSVDPDTAARLELLILLGKHPVEVVVRSTNVGGDSIICLLCRSR